MKRLIKSEIYDAYNWDNEYIEIFKNPIQEEIDIIKKQHNSVRGVIDQNGNKYIWNGNIDHLSINRGLEHKVPLDYFRFEITPESLYIDLSFFGAKITPNECREILKII